MELTFKEIDDLDTNLQSLQTYFELPKTTHNSFDKSKSKQKPTQINNLKHKSINNTNKIEQLREIGEIKEINNLVQNINTNTIHNHKPVLKKALVSYDDILKNMNLTLINGKLEFAPQPNLNSSKKTVHFQEQEPYVENREELLKQKIIDYANYRNEIIRASKIKSTRLQFTNNNNPSIYTRQTAFNSLFTLKN
jgi:hypothetical protein